MVWLLNLFLSFSWQMESKNIETLLTSAKALLSLLNFIRENC